MKKIFAPEKERENIRGWLIHARKYWKMHTNAAVQLEARYRLVGIVSLILSAIVGASLFSSLVDYNEWGKIVAGSLSIIASVLASLLTFQQYQERTELHRKAAAGYKTALRTLERLHTVIHVENSNQLDEQSITKIKEKLDALDEMSPVIPQKIFDEIDKDQFIFIANADELRCEENDRK